MKAQESRETNLAGLLKKAYVSGYTRRFVIVDRHTIKDELSDQPIFPYQVMMVKRTRFTDPANGQIHWFCLIEATKGRKGWLVYPERGPHAVSANSFIFKTGRVPVGFE